MAKDLLFEADRFEADRFEVALAIDRLARDVGCKLFEPSNTALLLVVEALVHACGWLPRATPRSCLVHRNGIRGWSRSGVEDSTNSAWRSSASTPWSGSPWLRTSMH